LKLLKIDNKILDFRTNPRAFTIYKTSNFKEQPAAKKYKVYRLALTLVFLTPLAWRSTPTMHGYATRPSHLLCGFSIHCLSGAQGKYSRLKNKTDW